MTDALSPLPPPFALLQAARPGNVLLAGIGCTTGALAASHPEALDAVTLAPFAVAFLVGALGTAGGNILNDVMDRELDGVAHPTRPIPSGRLSTRTASIASAVLFLAAATLGFLRSVAAGTLIVALALLLVAYETRLKRRGLPGNITIALAAGALFPLGALIVHGALQVAALLGGVAALAHLGRELLKDAEDAAADARTRRTFAVRHGPDAAARLAVLPLLAAVIAAPLPVPLAGWPPGYLAAVLPALFLFLAAASNAIRKPARAQRLAKAAMVLAVAAFLVGALL